MNENIKNLLELIQQNPTMKVVTMVSYEIFCGDEYHYWLGSIGGSVVTKMYNDGKRIWLEDEIDDLVEKFIDNYDGFKQYTEEEIEKYAKETVNSYPWETVIVVYIELPE